MSISVTIPQLFYDLIARMVPGCLFLVLLALEFSGVGNGQAIQDLASGNSVATLLAGIIGGIFSYLVGWVLHAFTFRSAQGRSKAAVEARAGGALSTSEMYNRIRIENETVGFRVTKLRAEARMLETCRTGMVLAVVVALSLMLLEALAVLPTSGQSGPVWAAKVGVPFILGAAFWKCERPAWEKYFGNIVSHYRLLCAKGQARDERQPEKQEAAR